MNHTSRPFRIWNPFYNVVFRSGAVQDCSNLKICFQYFLLEPFDSCHLRTFYNVNCIMTLISKYKETITKSNNTLNYFLFLLDHRKIVSSILYGIQFQFVVLAQRTFSMT